MKTLKRLEGGTPASRQLGMERPLYVNEVRRDDIGLGPGKLDGIPDAEKYATRQVFASSRGDTVAIMESRRPETFALREYLVGLEVTDLREEDFLVLPDGHCMVQDVREQLVNGSLDDRKLSHVIPFVHCAETDAINALTEVDAGPPSTNMRHNLSHKGNVMNSLRGLGCPVLRGFSVTTAREARAMVDVLRLMGVRKACFKIAQSADGIGIHHFDVNDVDSIERYLSDPLIQRSLDGQGIYVEEFVPDNQHGSIGLTFFIGRDPKESRLLGIAEQGMKKKNEGDPIPTQHKASYSHSRLAGHRDVPLIMESVLKLADVTGYSGYLGVDAFARGDDFAGSRMVVCDVNPRITGSITGVMLGHNLLGSVEESDRHVGQHNERPIAEGASANDYIAFLDREGLAYDPSERRGVIPINLMSQYAQVVVVGRSRAEVMELIEAAGMKSKSARASGDRPQGRVRRILSDLVTRRTDIVDHGISGIGPGSFFGGGLRRAPVDAADEFQIP